ncbi:MAG TPA: DUF748 domain-containing protein [Terriglobia bacterium]|nr:DUF748 domain-containing protein [Terriglobia bacterium]
MRTNASGSSRRRLWKRVAFGAGLLLAAYTLFGFFIVPRLIRNYVITQAKTQLNRQARIDEVRFNPFTLVTTIRGFVLSDRDNADLMKVEHFLADLQLSGMFRRAIRFREVRIERPFLSARILQDGQPSVADLIETRTGTTVAEESAEPFQLPRLVIDRLVLAKGGVGFTDSSRQPAYESRLEPLNLEIRHLITLPDESGDHTITIGFENSAVLKWTGRQTVEPLRFSGQLDITGLPIPRLWDYFGQRQPLDVHGGTVDLSVPYELTRGTDKTLQANLNGVSATVRSLAARHRVENIDWLTVPEVSIEGVNARWPEAQLEVEKVRVVGAHVLTKLGTDRKLNWTTLASERPKVVQSETRWQLRIASFDIENASATFEDNGVEPAVKIELSGLGARAEGISSKLESAIPVTLKGRLQENGTIDASGTLALSPLAADAKFNVQNVDLTGLRSYFETPPAPKLSSGLADVQGKVVVSGPAPSIGITGGVTLRDVEILDAADKRLAAWKRLQIDGLTYDSAPGRARVKKVTIDQPFANILIDEAGYLNLRKVPSSSSSNTTTANSKPLSLEVGVIEFRDGTADFQDLSLLLPFRAEIHSANGTVRDVSSFAAAPATLALEGRVDKTGYVKTGGTLRLSNPLASSEVNVQFRSIEMLGLTPYFAHFAGYEVKSGVLDLDVDYVIKDRRLVGDHTLVARNLALGARVKDSKAPGLAVRLAVALLKDREGRINLKVPVEGTVDSPEFNYNAVFWSAVRTILGNAVRAPFRAIGGLFGRDEDDLELIEFDPGRSDLLPDEQQKLIKVAEHLGPKQEVKLTVEGRFDPEGDQAALKQQRLVRLIESRREGAGAAAAAAGASTLETILEALFVEQFSQEALDAERQRVTSPTPTTAPQPEGAAPPPPSFDAASFYERLRARLLEVQTVTETDLQGLASARATAIVEILNKSGSIEPARVVAATPATAKRKKNGSTRVASEIAMSAEDDQ